MFQRGTTMLILQNMILKQTYNSLVLAVLVKTSSVIIQIQIKTQSTEMTGLYFSKISVSSKVKG